MESANDVYAIIGTLISTEVVQGPVERNKRFLQGAFATTSVAVTQRTTSAPDS